MITKQQFERFNEHFVVRETVTISADFDLNTTFDEIKDALQQIHSSKILLGKKHTLKRLSQMVTLSIPKHQIRSFNLYRI